MYLLHITLFNYGKEGIKNKSVSYNNIRLNKIVRKRIQTIKSVIFIFVVNN